MGLFGGGGLGGLLGGGGGGGLGGLGGGGGGWMAGLGDWIGGAVQGYGNYRGDRERDKEWKDMQMAVGAWLTQYLQDPRLKAASDMVMSLLNTGDYQGIFAGMYNRQMQETKNRVQGAQARGGLLRTGAAEDIMARSGKDAAWNSAMAQLQAKQWASGQAQNLAQNEFNAKMGVQPTLLNPYTGYLWNEVAHSGQVFASGWNRAYGGGQGSDTTPKPTTGQQNAQQYMNNMNGPNMGQPQNTGLMQSGGPSGWGGGTYDWAGANQNPYNSAYQSPGGGYLYQGQGVPWADDKAAFYNTGYAK